MLNIIYVVDDLSTQKYIKIVTDEMLKATAVKYNIANYKKFKKIAYETLIPDTFFRMYKNMLMYCYSDRTFLDNLEKHGYDEHKIHTLKVLAEYLTIVCVAFDLKEKDVSKKADRLSTVFKFVANRNECEDWYFKTSTGSLLKDNINGMGRQEMMGFMLVFNTWVRKIIKRYAAEVRRYKYYKED